MSYIIDNRCGKYFNKLNKRKSCRNKWKQQSSTNPQKEQDFKEKGLIADVIPRFLRAAAFQIKFSHSRRFVLEPIPLVFGFMAGIELRLEDHHHHNFLKMRIIDKNGLLFRFHFQHHRVLLSKQFSLNQKLTIPLMGRINISMRTGQLKIVFSLNIKLNECEFAGQNLLKWKNMFNKFILQSVEEGKYVICLIKLLMGREDSQICCIKGVQAFQLERRSKIMNLNRYNQMLMVKKAELDCTFNKKRAMILQNEQKSIQSIKQLLTLKVEFSLDMQKLSGMYNIFDRQIQQYKSAQQYEINEEEFGKLGKFIDLPYLQRHGIESQSSQNYILIKNIHDLKLMPLNSGGFSNIYSAETEFWIMQNAKITNSPNLPPLRKFLVFKRALPQSKDHSKQKDRNLHERFIISKLKNSSSVYLNTYYTPTNKPNPFEADIIMDYIPFSNIGEYIRMNRNILSLHTKIHLGFMIAQALRSLKSYEIVHVDLKPSNILIYCNLFLKIIDFGEAYHPQVCKKDYSPGFSIPYCSPEVHRSPVLITSKTDLFSFGIIFFQLLYGYTPFNFYKEESFKKLKTEQYLSHWFLVPQADESIGQTNIISYLLMLISHCLNGNESKRPELNFVSIMLRQCFEVLH